MICRIGLLLAACLMASVQAFGEDVCFTENGLIYSSVAPAPCGHYLGRHGKTDVMVRGYEPTLRFEAGQTTLRVPSTITHGDKTYNVVCVGKEAFVGLSTVEKIIVEDGIESIGSNAFACCPDLKSVYLPATLNGLGYSMFQESNNLKEIVIDPKCTNWESCEGSNAIMWGVEDNVELLQGCSGTKIPASVKIIGNEAFSGCHSLERIVLPEGVEEIGYLAFSGCSSLKEIVLPESLKLIGQDAFEGCSSLTSIYIPKNVNTIAGYNVFNGCYRLTSIVVDKDNAFYDSRSHCNGIVRKSDSTLVATCPATIITKDIKRLNGGCFHGTPVHSLRIPRTLVSVTGECFSSCTEIDEIIVDSKNPYYMSPQGSNALLTKDGKTLVLGCRTTELPEGVEEIGDYAFAGRYSKRMLNLPVGVKTIGRGAFKRCNEINNVVIPSSVTTLSESAFSDCQRLHSVQVFAPLEVIRNCTFMGCPSLIAINIPESVREIGYCAFSGCTNLKNVHLPSAIERIGFDAFKDCSFSPSSSDAAMK